MSDQARQQPQMPPNDQLHRNHGLFSDHFLRERVPPLEGDDLARAEQLRAEALRLLAKAEQRARGRREASVEDVLIRPLLTLLGFVYVPNPPLPTGAGAEGPDYALFESEEREEHAKDEHWGKREYFDSALALAEAKRWGDPFVTPRGGRSPKARRHPGKQTRDYLYESGVRWGILTNGRLWRLYEREASRGENFYEVDLLDLAQNPDTQAWRYFYLFFRREAFARDAEGRCHLDRWLAGSREYAVGLTKRLRDNVYEALRCLMEGFFAWQGNGLDWERDHERVHEASLVLLYRLLFVFYAEARGLLPVAVDAYREQYSLDHHKKEIAERLDRGHAYDEFGAALWRWLQDELFELVDQGNERLGVPQYNGGLFRADRWPLLHDRNIRIPDRYVAQAIDLLARDAGEGRAAARAFVDYAELGVRELGSVYEGLLEMRPHLATEPMIEAKRTAKEKQPSVIPEAEATEEQKRWSERNGRRYAPGQAYLLTDRGERKQTGSYYTPQYIVNYIVENTLNPLLTECARQVAERRPQFDKKIANLEKAITERGDGIDSTAERAAIEGLKLELLEPYFDLKVLDPAMGSGHFLVGAADFIADAILTDPNHIPPGDLEGEEEALYYKRRVVERCLYGVDLNPLAVELAKLSLWLHTVQRDRALSFLDHHLRCGDSLIGARIEQDLSREPPIFNARGKQTNKGSEQLVLGFYDTFRSRHLETFLQALAEIEGTPTTSAASERQKDTIYKTMDALREPYRQIANLWLAPYFGVPISSEQCQVAVDALQDGAESSAWAVLANDPWFKQAQEVAKERRFFHWELEFPEVWYEQGRRRENQGFEAVVGNPPYGRVAEPILQSYFRSVFHSPEFKVDTYSLFGELGLGLSRPGGRFSLIVPNTLATNATERHLRGMLLRLGGFTRLLTFPDDVFEEAVVHSLVFVWERRTGETPADATGVLVDRCGLGTREVLLADLLGQPGDQFLLFQDVSESHILARVDRVSTPLGGMLDVRQCIKTGDDESWLLSKRTHARHKPVLGGMHMDRYQVTSPESLFVDYGDWLACPRDPAVFEQAKIVIREAGARVACAKDEDRLYLLSSLYACVPYPDQDWPLAMDAVLAILNSSLICWIAKKRALESTSGAFTKLRIYQVEAFPIRRVGFVTPAKERAALVQELKGMYAEWVGSEEKKP